jgi:hypothetical protein
MAGTHRGVDSENVVCMNGTEQSPPMRAVNRHVTAPSRRAGHADYLRTGSFDRTTTHTRAISGYISLL